MKYHKIINTIIDALLAGPILPGGIKTQYTVCGKSGCRCQDKNNPQKHGPYHKLSYAVAGSDASMYIKEEHLDEAQKMVQRFVALKENINLLALEYAQLLHRHHFDTSKLPCLGELMENKHTLSVHAPAGDATNWKQKALLRQKTILYTNVKLRDIAQSRQQWKEKAIERKTEISQLRRTLPKEQQLPVLQKKTRKRQK